MSEIVHLYQQQVSNAEWRTPSEAYKWSTSGLHLALFGPRPEVSTLPSACNAMVPTNEAKQQLGSFFDALVHRHCPSSVFRIRRPILSFLAMEMMFCGRMFEHSSTSLAYFVGPDPESELEPAATINSLKVNLNANSGAARAIQSTR